MADRGAPQSVVEAVQEALECSRYDRPSGPVCAGSHDDLPNWTARGCETAVEAADAAFAASLREIADDVPDVDTEQMLRRWADESEADRG